MKYSFVLIAYNEEENIVSCIESILAQDNLGSNYEIIVVDDGSRDKTAELVKELTESNKHIRLISDGRNHGRGYGRNTGVNSSSGDYVNMVDADILLPKTWLTTCLMHIQKHDVVGGIAVPDGDVAYIFRKFNFKPKTVMGSTTITGNNGMYKREIFTKINFDKNRREGEDVDFNHHQIASGGSMYCIPDLTVEHQESKSFLRSMLWLYQSGVGATRQLLRFHELRLPDLAFAATILVTIAAFALTVTTDNGIWFAVPILSIAAASLMHLQGKFYLPVRRVFSNFGALLTDAILIFCYYLGRTNGIVAYLLDSGRVR